MEVRGEPQRASSTAQRIVKELSAGTKSLLFGCAAKISRRGRPRSARFGLDECAAYGRRRVGDHRLRPVLFCRKTQARRDRGTASYRSQGSERHAHRHRSAQHARPFASTREVSDGSSRGRSRRCEYPGRAGVSVRRQRRPIRRAEWIAPLHWSASRSRRYGKRSDKDQVFSPKRAGGRRNACALGLSPTLPPKRLVRRRLEAIADAPSISRFGPARRKIRHS